MSDATIRCQFRAPREADTHAHVPPPSRAARMLALAHHIYCLVDAGDLASYAAAAEVLGLTRARLTQVMNLLLLAPEVQEQLLTGDIALTERSLRRVVAEADWEVQRKLRPGGHETGGGTAMSKVPFHSPRMGRVFFESTMSELVRQLMRLNENLEKAVETTAESDPDHPADPMETDDAQEEILNL